MPRQYTFKALILLLLGAMSFDVASSSDEIIRALELQPDLNNGKKIYGLCASCHHDNGWGKADGSFPVIAGQHRRVLIKQLADIRSRDRQNPTMFPFTDPDTIGGAQAISDVTAYIASLPADPNPGTGDGKALDTGKRLYHTKCSQCHGDQAQGNDAGFIPKLRGQHYSYLLRQIQWISNGFRKNSNPAMVQQVKTMS
ncbi:MAG: c-type cytochrome, partial [Gammaproteobacteria bacterium]